MKAPDWDEYFMTLVYLVAMRSKDDRTHVGAVVVGPDHEIRSTGYNSFPRNIQDDIPDRQVSPSKYMWIEHAERNSIYSAALVGIPLKNCTLYTNGLPCSDCARAVIQAGIKEIVIDADWDKGSNRDQWKNSQSCAMTMLQEAGVGVRAWSGELLQQAEKMQEDILKEFFDIAGKNKEEPSLIVNLKEGIRDDIG